MRLSVITINLNNAAGLKKTIESVLSQTWTNFEYIIIDGASTDDSINIIKELENSLASATLHPNANFTNFKLTWMSEIDSGIYNAMNKGIKLAKGEFIHFLNSGDWLVNNMVYEKINDLTSWNKDIIYGNRIEIHSDCTGIINKGLQKSDLIFDDVYRGCIFHTAVFTKKELFTQYGLFDESFKILSDTAFFLKAVGIGQSSTEYIDCTISCFNMHGISNDPNNEALRNSELIELRKKTISPRLVEIFEFYQKYAYKIERIQKNNIANFLFRGINRLSYIISKIVN